MDEHGNFRPHKHVSPKNLPAKQRILERSIDFLVTVLKTQMLPDMATVAMITGRSIEDTQAIMDTILREHDERQRVDANALHAQAKKIRVPTPLKEKSKKRKGGFDYEEDGEGEEDDGIDVGIGGTIGDKVIFGGGGLASVGGMSSVRVGKNGKRQAVERPVNSRYGLRPASQKGSQLETIDEEEQGGDPGVFKFGGPLSSGLNLQEFAEETMF